MSDTQTIFLIMLFIAIIGFNIAGWLIIENLFFVHNGPLYVILFFLLIAIDLAAIAFLALGVLGVFG